MQHDRHADRVCACCARPAIGYGVVGQYQTKALWVCDDPECLVVGQITMGLKQLEFNRLDALAADEAGGPVGATIETLCDQFGKSDLRQLTQAEWDELCKAISRQAVATYRDALQTKLRNEAPF